ncbi:aminoglycoside phosphotransferase family protein [Streptomyces sp. NPDC091272]|uniref:aminoglycoside phosphotransferase family protein n=1 Tax=Streptomyces sp. NPDC091272 TaxID=3365981 RepID=UPI003808CE2E
MCAAGDKMHSDEADIDVPLVRRLIAAQFPQWATLPVEAVASSGTENAMFRLGTDLAVRLPRIARAVADVEREQRWLPELGARLPLPIPAPVGTGVAGAGFPWAWSVYRWLEGSNPVVGHVPHPVLLAAELAEFVTALRRIEPVPGAPVSGRGGPLASPGRVTATRDAIEELRGLPEEGVDADAVTAVWEAALALPGSATAGTAHWVHGDLSPGNVLLRDGRLSAVIDFGTVGVGGDTVDLAPAWNLLPAEARPAFRAGLRADDAAWELGRAWALSIALIQLPYYRKTNPALAANSRHVIREVLTDAAHALSPAKG